MAVSQKQVDAGQAIYTERTLAWYDFIVLGVSNRLIWRCPTPQLLAHYDRFVSANHLDVGVGTGYFLDRCRFPSQTPRVALMDLNTEALAFAAGRIARYKPEQYRRNVLQPIAFDEEKFDSVGCNYLLHCLPGNMASKAIIFDHLKALMKPGAVLFGATLLQGGVPRSWAAKALMGVYNKKGIFSNQQDHLDGLDTALRQAFSDVQIAIHGCAAVFWARR